VTSDSQQQSSTQIQTTDNDYDYSRETYYELIEKGKDALEDMINVARESEHPRAFEVLSGMIKNISDVNDRLMDLNKKKKELDRKDETVKQIENQQNNFYLSTSELQKMMTQGEVVDADPDPKLLRES
jgi:DNA-binding PadR family transcriptional regulator